MTVTLPNNERGTGKIILLLLATVIAFSIAVGTLSSLPMTRHAEQGRTGTNLDADAIRKMIDQRKCKPIEVYVCPPVKQSKLMCFLKPMPEDQLWAGVIVGIDLPHPIITGYVAPYFGYWIGANERDGCYLVSRIN